MEFKSYEEKTIKRKIKTNFFVVKIKRNLINDLKTSVNFNIEK